MVAGTHQAIIDDFWNMGGAGTRLGTGSTAEASPAGATPASGGNADDWTSIFGMTADAAANARRQNTLLGAMQYLQQGRAIPQGVMNQLNDLYGADVGSVLGLRPDEVVDSNNAADFQKFVNTPSFARYGVPGVDLPDDPQAAMQVYQDAVRRADPNTLNAIARNEDQARRDFANEFAGRLDNDAFRNASQTFLGDFAEVARGTLSSLGQVPQGQTAIGFDYRTPNADPTTLRSFLSGGANLRPITSNAQYAQPAQGIAPTPQQSTGGLGGLGGQQPQPQQPQQSTGGLGGLGGQQPQPQQPNFGQQFNDQMNQWQTQFGDMLSQWQQQIAGTNNPTFGPGSGGNGWGGFGGNWGGQISPVYRPGGQSGAIDDQPRNGWGGPWQSNNPFSPTF